MTLNLPGDAGNWSYLHWRNIVTAVAKFVRKAKEQARTSVPEPPDLVDVLRKYRRLIDELESAVVDPIPELAEKIWRDVKLATEKFDSEVMLKYTFVRQQLRLEKLIEQEQRLGIIMPEATRIGWTILRVAAELRKLEIGKEGLRCMRKTIPNL